MRAARMSLAIALALLASLALGVSTASSDFVREVTDEATGSHCGGTVAENVAPATPEVSGGCPIRFEGASIEVGGPLGAMTECHLSIEGRIGEAAAAIAANYTISSCDPTPNVVTVCTGNGDRHPRLEISGDKAGNAWPIEANMCFSMLGATVRCHVTATLVDLGSHSYRLDFTHDSKCEGNSSYSLEGQLTQTVDAGHPAIEIRDVEIPEVTFAEASTEGTSEHCATTITEEGGEGCPVRVTGEAVIWTFSNPTVCQLDMEGRISESGTLMVDSWAFTPSPCGWFVPCTGAGQRHPEATITGGASPSWTTEWTYCLLIPNANPPTPLECHVAGTLSEVATHTYQYELEANQRCIGAISMAAVLTITPDEEHPAVEIN